MNVLYRPEALTDPVDLLLADIALRIQLSPTQYDTAVSRYQTIAAWVERDGSPLAGLVARFYPQGSMSIGATISSRMDAEDHDIDVIVELLLPPDTPPQVVLDLLYLAVRGEPGSRYYEMTERRTRCVTVRYADMHLDLTPAILVPERQPLTSWIFHHKPDAPDEPTYRTLANPHGFAEWYRAHTPLDNAFAEAFVRLARDRPGYEPIALAEADTEPVPEHEPIVRKSKALVVLQLTKRWRNKQYQHRAGRRPPSPLIARLNAEAANHTSTLAEELEHQARHMLGCFEAAQRRGELLEVTNPRCHEDVFTDRWPGTSGAQKRFISDLRKLVASAHRLRQPDRNLDQIRAIMAELFGEHPTGAAFEAFNETLGQAVQSGRIVTDQTGRLNLGRSGIIAGAPAVSTPRPSERAPRHTFFGGRWRRW